MKDGMFVFDAVVHCQDFSDGQIKDGSDGSRVRILRQHQINMINLTGRRGPPPEVETFSRPDLDWGNEMLFEKSDTDLACACSVPLFAHWKAGLGPVEMSHAFAQSNPSRVVLTGAVDPAYQGLDFALKEMERQVHELGAVSFKFYQYQSRGCSWRADDRDIAYPIWEKAIELGIKLVQFHKGFPLELGPVEAFRPNDLQYPAADFPELNFGIHHLGDPYVEETLSIAARFENVYLVLPLWFNQYYLQPYKMLHRLGDALLYVGSERICYGSEAFIWPHVQTYIDTLANLEMPEDLQENYGYPDITREMKENMLGRAFATAMGIDIEAKKRELGLA